MALKILIFYAITVMLIISCNTKMNTNPNPDTGKNPVQEQKQGTLPRYKEGEVLVRFRDGIPRTRIEEILNRLALTILYSYAIPNLYLVQAPRDETVETILEKLQTYPEVLYSEPNPIISIQPKVK